VNIHVLANDYDKDKDLLNVTTVSTPLHGSAVITSNNKTVTYIPTASFFGSDSFTYTVSDGHSINGTAKATVTVNVKQASSNLDKSVLFVFSTGSVAWGKNMRAVGILIDNTTGFPIPRATITFTGTGTTGLPRSVTTKPLGIFIATWPSPSTVGTWTLQAHYAGNSIHQGADSNKLTYSTLKHRTSVSLTISPSAIKSGAVYAVSGILTDLGRTGGISSKTITFQATSPIKIPSTTTGTTGKYLVGGLKAPANGRYSIQALFSGDLLYGAGGSPKHTLTVK